MGVVHGWLGVLLAQFCAVVHSDAARMVPCVVCVVMCMVRDMILRSEFIILACTNIARLRSKMLSFGCIHPPSVRVSDLFSVFDGLQICIVSVND